MEWFVELVFRWQTLAGAFSGGVFALFVALAVAANARFRDEVAASMLLIAELKSVENSIKSFFKSQGEVDIPEGSRAEELLRYAKPIKLIRPHLSTFFDSYMARAMPADKMLAVHLSCFRDHIRMAEQNYNSIDFSEQEILKIMGIGTGASITLRDSLRTDLLAAVKEMKSAALEAGEATPLLSDLFDTCIPTIRRGCRRLRSWFLKLWLRFKKVFHPKTDRAGCA